MTPLLFWNITTPFFNIYNINIVDNDKIIHRALALLHNYKKVYLSILPELLHIRWLLVE